MSREEIRVDGLTEPISHFTDAVRAGNLLFVSGIVPVDSEGALVGRDDVVAQTRQVFENMQAILAAVGCGFEDVVKVTVFLTNVDDRPLINPVRQGGVRVGPAGEHARRGVAARRPRREGRDRGRRPRPMTRDPGTRSSRATDEVVLAAGRMGATVAAVRRRPHPRTAAAPLKAPCRIGTFGDRWERDSVTAAGFACCRG